MATILSETTTSIPDMTGINRAVAYMTDGTAVLLVHRTGSGVRLYDNHSGTFNNYFAFTDDIVGGRYLSLTIDSSNNIHLVYTSSAGNVQYVKMTYDGSYAWTPGTSELVRTLPGSTTIGRKDIEVLDGGVVVVAWLESNNTNPSARIPTFRVRVRHSGGSWGTAFAATEMTTGSTTLARCCSIARDGETDAATPDSGYQRLGYAYSMPNAVGLKFGHIRVKLDDGAVDQQIEILNYTDRAVPHYGQVYSHGAGEWTFVGQKNHASGAGLCTTIFFRWKYGVGYTEQASALTQTNSTWPDVTATLPTTAMVGDKPVLVNSFTLSGRSAIVARVYHPGVGWGPQFNLVEGSAQNIASAVGTEFLRSGGNRHLPTNRLLVGSAMARTDLSSSTVRAHFAQVNPTPAAPTGLAPGIASASPSAAPIVGTSVPTLGATTGVVASGPVRRRVEWDTDTSSLFGTDPRTYVQPVAALQYSGSSHTLVVPGSSPLYTGVWFLRARAIDEFGLAGSWSGLNKYNVFHPPATTDYDPADGKLAGYGSGDVLLKWRFTDPYAGDQQSAYRISVVLESDGTVLLDTTKVASTVNEAIVNIDAAYKDQNLLWRVDVWDVDDSPSPNVTWSLFVLGDAPAVTIDAPADEVTLDAPLLNIDWSVVYGGTRSQAAYQVTVWDSTASKLAHTSGWVTGADDSYTVPGSALTNLHSYIISVNVRDTGGLLGSASITLDTAWTPPAAPAFTIDDSMFAEEGYIEITWDDAAIEDDFVYWVITASKVGEPAGSVLARFRLPVAASGTVRFPLVGPVDPWEIDVQQVVSRYGVDVYSNPDPVTLTLENPYYWLMPVDISGDLNPDTLIKLHNVIEDNPVEDQDYETHKLIGRGNKDDLGTRYGWTSALVCQLRDKPSLTAREQKERIVRLRTAGMMLMLRNPFGDVYMVNTGLLSFSRLAGVGLREFVDMTIPYHEVTLGLD